MIPCQASLGEALTSTSASLTPNWGAVMFVGGVEGVVRHATPEAAVVELDDRRWARIRFGQFDNDPHPWIVKVQSIDFIGAPTSSGDETRAKN